MKISFLILCFLFPFVSICQKTKVEGQVIDQVTGEKMPFVSVRFMDSKIGVFTDTSGKYTLDTYYATDTLVFSFSGYISVKKAVKKDVSQVIDVLMPVLTTDYEEVIVQAPDEFPSTILHKKVIAHKDINNKEKLESYEYEVYNKIQLDLNNISDEFKERGMVKKLEVIMNYLDSTDDGKSYLPLVLSESVSDYYYNKSPQRTREVVKATRISGVDNVEINQYLGDMYLNVNVYDNNLLLFNKSFISPVSNFARNFYRFYLEDSAFVDNYWCYKLTFTPKRTGDMTFEGEMWIHDTTYAVKSFKATISPWSNINYVQDLYIEHDFEQVAPEVWMLTSEKMIADIKLTQKSKLNGLFARRHSSRRNYIINKDRDLEFYKSNSTVELMEGAKDRTKEYWAGVRHDSLSLQELGIDEMIDSLENTPYFKKLESVIYMLTTGYYTVGKIEIGDAFGLFSGNSVEGFRLGLALRTSNNFSKKIEFGIRGAYGFRDSVLNNNPKGGHWKYGASLRANLSKKKRGLLTAYYNYDLEQIGAAQNAASTGSTFGTVLGNWSGRALTFVEKTGVNFERDIKKDAVLTVGFEWKEFTAIRLNPYLRMDQTTGLLESVPHIQTSEFLVKYSWVRNGEYISGAFDRQLMQIRYPILTLQGIFGVKDILGSDYDYQKIDFTIDHLTPIGFFGRLRYNLNAGYIFGAAAYPFLRVHQGNQTYVLVSDAFNKMNFFEFISDRYVSALIENHWDGLFFDRIPLIKKLKLRLVTTVQALYGGLSDKNKAQMVLPSTQKDFGNTPYVEVGMGVENLFKFGRVDVFWRLTHLDPGVKVTDLEAFGVRFNYYLNF